jgi:putative peptidoglycan lipid II flippase
VIGQFLPAVAGALLMSSTLIVDQAMAAMLSPGSVAALSYGNKVIGFVLTLLATTLTTVLTPFFSKKMAGGNSAEIYSPLRRSIIWVFSLSFVLPIVITLWSEPIVKLVFYRGMFTLEDVRLVAGIQSFLAWQIPFYICGVILMKFIASVQLNWIQPVVAGVNLAANIIMNYLLMQRMGINGIALSTTLVHIISLLLLVFFVYFSTKRAALVVGQ